MILYVDCSAGVSGDMLLAGLLDMGLPLSRVRAVLGQLQLPRVKVYSRPVWRHGVSATQVSIEHSNSSPGHLL